MVGIAVVISIPPFNTLIHGTHFVMAHSMGSMIGIDSMILWGAFAYMLQCGRGPSDPGASSTRVRAAIPFLTLFLAVFLASFLGNGVATSLDRYMGPSSPDWSNVLQAFPTVMAWSGLALATTVLWILAHWTVALLSGAAPPPPVPER